MKPGIQNNQKYLFSSKIHSVLLLNVWSASKKCVFLIQDGKKRDKTSEGGNVVSSSFWLPEK